MRDATGSGITPLRLYAALIALASGAYALWRVYDGMMVMTGMSGMTGPSAWLMGALGLIVIVHGIVLLTAVAASAAFASVSGPLMILWGTLMLLQQAWLALGSRTMMAWDVGMLLLALLMVASGGIMVREGSRTGPRARVGA